MTVSENLKLSALCVAAAAASSTVVTMLLPARVASHPQPASIIRSIPVQTSALPAPRPQTGYSARAANEDAMFDRFGFVPVHATNELFAALAEEEIAAEDASTWTSETTVALAPPSIVRLPHEATLKVPWENEAALRGRPYTLTQRLREIGPSAQERLHEKFVAAKAPWRPAELALVAIKDEKVLELYAKPPSGSWTFIHRYPVLAASGVTGPKLRRGDKQVPEGVYGISFLNPNSRYHVALRVNYPNAFDRRMGSKDGRTDLGGDIMIHGKAASVGCLAIGDAAAEELFVLAAETDFRKNPVPEPQDGQPRWLPALYTEVAAAMAPYKAPPSGGLLSLFSN
jgi:hypothetical protein